MTTTASGARATETGGGPGGAAVVVRAAPEHSRLYWALSDTATMIGRSLRLVGRKIDALLVSVVLPVILLLMFVYVFGGAIEAGTDAYIDYVVPGIIMMCAGYGAALTATTVANDMATGVIDRFRTLPIRGSAVLTGHVAASVLRNLLVTVLVFALALLLGFDPQAGPLEWVGAIAVLALYILTMSWLSVLFGLLARTVDGASGFTFVILFLPHVSSAFVPTDSMPTALGVFAEYQPITPVTETVRGLLMGIPVGDAPVAGLAWLVGILTASYVLAGIRFRRRTAH